MDEFHLIIFGEHQYHKERLGITPKQPLIDNIYSESLVAHLAPKILGGEAWRGGPGDLSVYFGEERKSAEVKGTGSCAFQELTPKDVKADYLIWIHFGNRYEVGSGEISLYVLENPAGKIAAGKIRLPAFQAIDGVREYRFSFETGRVKHVPALSAAA